MKKVMLICILCCLGLSGCYMHLNLNEAAFVNKETQMADMVEEITVAINNADVDGLKKVFSKNVQTDCLTLEPNIKAMFELFDHEITAFQKVGGVNQEKKVRDGKQRISIHASYRVEAGNHNFYMALNYCISDTFDTDEVGVQSLYIIREEDHKEPHIYLGGSQWLPGIVLE